MPGETSSVDKAAAQAVEGNPDPATEEPGGAKSEPAAAEMPAAGPHANPAFVNPDATPGTGALPEPGEEDGTDSTSS